MYTDLPSVWPLIILAGVGLLALVVGIPAALYFGIPTVLGFVCP